MTRVVTALCLVVASIGAFGCQYRWQFPQDSQEIPYIDFYGTTKVFLQVQEFSRSMPKFVRLEGYPAENAKINTSFREQLHTLPGFSSYPRDEAEAEKGLSCFVSVVPKPRPPWQTPLRIFSFLTVNVIPYYGEIEGYVVTYDLYEGKVLRKSYVYEVSFIVFQSLVAGAFGIPVLWSDEWTMGPEIKSFAAGGRKYTPRSRAYAEKVNNEFAQSMAESLSEGLRRSAITFWLEVRRDGLL